MVSWMALFKGSIYSGAFRDTTANPHLEEDWDPKMSLFGRWTAELHIPPLFCGMAVSVLRKSFSAREICAQCVS